MFLYVVLKSEIGVNIIKIIRGILFKKKVYLESHPVLICLLSCLCVGVACDVKNIWPARTFATFVLLCVF